MHTSESQIIQQHEEAKEPWQLRLFRRSLKKQQKLQSLLGVLGKVDGLNCVFITCGDNNGALNWHLKQHGGNWTWVDAEKDSIEQIEAVTGDRVSIIDKDNPKLSFSDNTFDVVMTNDIHEHIQHPHALNKEIARVTKPGGRVILTTPRGDESKLGARIKNLVGMGVDVYGHVVAGFDIPELEKQLKDVDLIPYQNTSYSFFFTEMLELAINFLYVKILSKRGKAKVNPGQITPQNPEQVKSVEKSLRLYTLIYPILWTISRLDALIRFTGGYQVVVAGRKE